MEFWMTEKRAKHIAMILQGICAVMLLFALATVVLLVLGRIQVRLTVPGAHYDRALLVEEDHAAGSRAFFFTTSEDLYLETGGQVAPLTRVLVPVIGLLRVFPMGFCFLWLFRFFGNVADGRVFAAENAKLFLEAGAALLFFSLITPLLNGALIPLLIGLFTDNELGVSAQPDLTALFFGAVLLVAAYVFRYGIYLQDEADHTL